MHLETRLKFWACLELLHLASQKAPNGDIASSKIASHATRQCRHNPFKSANQQLFVSIRLGSDHSCDVVLKTSSYFLTREPRSPTHNLRYSSFNPPKPE